MNHIPPAKAQEKGAEKAAFQQANIAEDFSGLWQVNDDN